MFPLSLSRVVVSVEIIYDYSYYSVSWLAYWSAWWPLAFCRMIFMALCRLTTQTIYYFRCMNKKANCDFHMLNNFKDLTILHAVTRLLDVFIVWEHHLGTYSATFIISFLYSDWDTKSWSTLRWTEEARVNTKCSDATTLPTAHSLILHNLKLTKAIHLIFMPLKMSGLSRVSV